MKALNWTIVGLALASLGGCEAYREQTTRFRGADVVQSDASPQSGEACDGCRRKWSARPNGGVNGPPWSG